MGLEKWITSITMTILKSSPPQNLQQIVANFLYPFILQKYLFLTFFLQIFILQKYENIADGMTQTILTWKTDISQYHYEEYLFFMEAVDIGMARWYN